MIVHRETARKGTNAGGNRNFFDATTGKKVHLLAAFESYVRGVRLTGNPAEDGESYKWNSPVGIPPAVEGEINRRVIEYRRLRNTAGNEEALKAVNKMETPFRIYLDIKEIKF